MLQRYGPPRLHIAQALVVDGKRIRGANRNSEDHHETVTLVEHGSRMPAAMLDVHDQGGNIAAVRAVLETLLIAGRVITFDALHTTRDTAWLIVETHEASMSWRKPFWRMV